MFPLYLCLNIVQSSKRLANSQFQIISFVDLAILGSKSNQISIISTLKLFLKEYVSVNWYFRKYFSSRFRMKSSQFSLFTFRSGGYSILKSLCLKELYILHCIHASCVYDNWTPNVHIQANNINRYKSDWLPYMATLSIQYTGCIDL